MKKSLTYFIAILLLPTIFNGCAGQLPEQETITVLNEESVYLRRIAELEAALAQEKEARYISDAAYAETIKTLQSRLDALTVNGTDPEQSAPTNDLVFRYKLEGSNAVITGFSGSSTLVSIPAALDGHPVTAIGERAFEGQSITAVVLPEGLESIGWFAFYGCKTLIDVTIPNSVSSIGYAVFDGCPNVTLVCHKDSYAAAYAASYGLACISPF
jgi:hypothetical protein